MTQKNKTHHTPFGRVVRALRAYNDITLTEMGEAMNLSNGYLSLVETGKRNPTMELIEGIINYFSLNERDIEALVSAANRSIIVIEESKYDKDMLLDRGEKITFH